MNNRKRGSDPNNELYRAILKLRTPEECYAFMEDLCTQTELKALEQLGIGLELLIVFHA